MADQTNLPNAFLSIFTPAELRVIRAIFAAISAEGRCTKRLDEIAAMASASRSTARNSIKQAVSYGLLERCERRFVTAVSAPNILTAPGITFSDGSPKW
jgi:DNA-binding MarR family transcriptional regulator